MSSSFTLGDGDGPRPTPPPSGEPQLPTDPAGLLVEQGRAGTDTAREFIDRIVAINEEHGMGGPPPRDVYERAIHACETIAQRVAKGVKR